MKIFEKTDLITSSASDCRLLQVMPSGVLLQLLWWREEDSNLRSRPTTDLQSVPFGHSGIPPGKISTTIKWSWRWDSNPQPADYKSAALPVELRQQALCTIEICFTNSSSETKIPVIAPFTSLVKIFFSIKFRSSQLPATTNVIFAVRLFSSLPLHSHL
jgi:hypothetical protein